jgi:hypothetical protein
MPILHAQGVVGFPDGSSPIKTELVATLTYASPFPNALAGTTTVTVGAGLSIDSYDSSKGTYGQMTFPFSPVLPNAGYSAIVAGTNVSSSVYAVTLGSSVVVNGYVAAKPSTASPLYPNFSYDSTTTIIKSGPAIPTPKVDLSRVSRAPFIPALAVKPVTGGILLTLVQGSDNPVGALGDTAPTVYYTTGDLDFTDPLTTLTVNGPIVLNVIGDINLGSAPGSKLIISSTGSAEIHFSGTISCVDLLGGGIENQTFNPLKLIFVSPTASTTNTFNSTLDFYGAIYVPNGAITWNGRDLYGAISADTVTINGGAVHSDIALKKMAVAGVETAFVTEKWREILGGADPDHVPGW